MKATQITFFLFFFFIIKCFHNFFDFIFVEKMKTGFFYFNANDKISFFSSLSLALTVTHKKRANSFANKLIINASVKTFSFSSSNSQNKSCWQSRITKSILFDFLSFAEGGVCALMMSNMKRLYFEIQRL